MRPLLLFIALLIADLKQGHAQETELWDLVVVANDIGTERLTEKELRDHMNARRNF